MTSPLLATLRCGVLAVVALAPVVHAVQDAVDFDADVQPILEAHCFECHGRHQQKAGLRLDQKAAALAGSSFGVDAVLVAGERDASYLWAMVTSDSDYERMPPSPRDALSADELDVLGRWIDEGLSWRDNGEEASWPMRHWAYQAPEALAPPDVADDLADWPRNDVDRFLARAMHNAGLSPQSLADAGTLLRRASLDLTGLPPTVAQLDAFLANSDDNAWSRALDDFMASPHYGEQQAATWLDLARYADSNGYEKDDARSIWPYRDWVIEAYANDLGYDDFTRAQIAGDLLPDANTSSRIATGFHRNTMVNAEGGVDPEEFRVAAVKDRADTTAAVWLGSTLACAQCHNHKFDPFTQRDYYQLYAFFDQTTDIGPSTQPMLNVDTPEQRAEQRAVEEDIAAYLASFDVDVPAAFAWTGAHVPEGASLHGTWDTQSALGRENVRDVSATGFVQSHFQAATAPLVILPGDMLYADVWLDADTPTRELFLQYHVAGGNWEHRAFLGEDLQHWGALGTPSRRHIGDLPAPGTWQRVTVDPSQLDLPLGTRVDGMAFGQFDGRVVWGEAGLITANANPTSPLPDDLDARRKRAFRSVTTLVMQAVDEPRTTHLLEKGSFLSPGVEVRASIPGVLRMKGVPKPRDRLEFADWLVDESNPLTARVEVNRVWQQLFGTGLVATVDDFGTRGERPSHPELLDWLAVEFMDNGWSRKWLLRTLMNSAAYRQRATVDADAIRADPENRLLARFPRLRLRGENLRDLHLSVSGLLTPDVGGPSVFPPQPPGIDQGTYAGDRWRTSTGRDRYRRGLYTFWRRTSPYPTFVLFDATSRELLCARRDSSTTPLQALALLNDPAFAETTRAFADELAALKLDDNAARIRHGHLACTAREPSPQTLNVLLDLLAQDGWESVARVLLNLDETINRG